MKTKKLVSLFLAVAMIFAVLTVSVSADLDINTGTSDGVNCQGKGTLLFVNSTRQATATTKAINKSGTTMDFRVQVQCAINYSDNTYDFDVNSRTETLLDRGTSYCDVIVAASSTKTIISFTCEYHIGDLSYNSLWEGYLGPNYYLGINS